VGPAVVVANSLGCQVALAMVEQLPEPAVERLLLLGPTMDPAAPTPIRQALRLTADVPREKPALWAIAFRDYVWAGPWRCWTTLRLALADDPLARIARVNRPTLVVRGSRDPIVSSAWAQRLAAAAPAGRYEEIAGAPHAAHMAMPVQVADLITRFALSMPG
jgi:2-hydroxy-6-oxonona-2,4-dienedioate hydrolase